MKKMLMMMYKMLLVVMVLTMVMAMTCKAETYPLTTVVVDVDRMEDVVTVIDFNGNEWQFDGCEDWFVGDVCSMVMDDMNTDIVYDDEIVDLRYDGWLDGWIERVCD